MRVNGILSLLYVEKFLRRVQLKAFFHDKEDDSNTKFSNLSSEERAVLQNLSTGTAQPGMGGWGSFSPPNNFGKKFFSIEKLLFYCFHRYAIINEDFRQ